MCGSLSIAICEDVPSERELLLSLARDWARARARTFPSRRLPRRRRLSFTAPGGKEFDLLLLDIGMRGMSGMELARELRAQGCGAQIVFITGYADCMAEGYDVGALHYLLKPVSREKLFSVLDRARAICPNPGARCSCPAAMERRAFLRRKSSMPKCFPTAWFFTRMARTLRRA